jgi:hypothetical protein
MKKLLTLLTMALIAISANAQAVIAEVDWTQKSEWDGGWYSNDYATVSVEQGTGLIIDNSSDGTTNYWEPQVPMISHIPEIEEGGQYQVKFQFTSPVAGELRLDLYSWDGSGATMAHVFEVAEGDNDMTIDFLDYPTPCTDAGIFYMCGKLPGRHIIKNVKVYSRAPSIPYNQADICYNFIAKGKVAEVISNSKKKYRGVVEIPASVMHDGEEYTVSKIADNAFESCVSLSSVTIPNSVTSIGESAFSGCRSLISLVIPKSVTSIGSQAFYGCYGLTSIKVESGNKYYDSRNDCNALIESSSNTLIVGCNNSTIPNSVISIGNYAFQNCTGLTSIIIPNSVITIGSNAFSGCSNLTSITIPNSVTTIGGNAFSGCIGLTSLTIPNSVTYLSGFSGCIGLTSIVIPNSVTTIGSYAFSGCKNLTSVTIGSGVKTIENLPFSNCTELTDVYCHMEVLPSIYGDNPFEGSYHQYINLHVPSISIDAYRNNEPWKSFKSLVAINDGDIPETPKCAKPEISFENGRVKFTCETEGVEYISEVKLADEHKYYDAEIQLSQTYKVSVYATKAGYDNSDVTTREIVIKGDNKAIVVGDVDGDGKVNVADHVKLSDIIMEKK